MRFSALAAFVMLFLAFAAPIRAAEPAIFEMADGSAYHPASGLKAESRAALLRQLQAATEPSAAEPAAVDSATAPLLAAIDRGRAMIVERIAALKPEKPVVVTSYDIWVDITLAVWDARTDEITLLDMKKSGYKTEPANSPFGKIVVTRNNGVNSEFTFDDENAHVVAVRYPIFKDISAKKNGTKFELQDVLYTPYSKRLLVPEVVARGKDTLRGIIAEAYAGIRADGLTSRAMPGVALADTVDPTLVEAIAVIEHLSESSMLGPNPERAMDSVYVIMAGNGRDAYAYSRSSAGAKGLVQFIPSTYALMTKRKELKLNPDFETGMSDPLNAVRAQIAYLDAELAGMPLAVRDLYNVDPLRVGEYMAAAYNGGGTRVRRAITTWGEGWSELHDAEIAQARKQSKAKGTKLYDATLRKETANYVLKLRQAIRVLKPLVIPVVSV